MPLPVNIAHLLRQQRKETLHKNDKHEEKPKDMIDILNEQRRQILQTIKQEESRRSERSFKRSEFETSTVVAKVSGNLWYEESESSYMLENNSNKDYMD